MLVLNLAGCPIGVRFTVVAMVRIGNKTCAKIKNSYIGVIELEQLYKIGELEGTRIYPRPATGSASEYYGLTPTVMWLEGLTTTELREYLDD